ncbi:MAG: hypothetical protein NZ654_14365, partial [Acidimicrobiales bacterium]|nr:hypothetical protein [Acidimicrobiales bacterium]
TSRKGKPETMTNAIHCHDHGQPAGARAVDSRVLVSANPAVYPMVSSYLPTPIGAKTFWFWTTCRRPWGATS